jgi:hypothetical protein
MITDDTLFHGIAVLIDDEIHDPKSSVKKIQNAIEEAGCHVVPLSAIPGEASVPNFREVAFFVLDWKLYGADLKVEEGIPLPAPPEIVQANEESIFKFLKDLKKIRYAPVFIFTDEPTENIVDKLKQNDLYDESDSSHILVMDKTEVFDSGVFKVLTKWMEGAPSVYVLKSWERAYEKAKNELFIDFYGKSTWWPLVLWKNFKADSMPPAALLGDLIGRNLVSRMAPFTCDLEPFEELLDGVKKDEKAYQDIVRNVFEGERFLAADRLDDKAFEPGDIFQLDDGYRINIRPDCDCVPRGSDTLDRLELYLLKGTERSFADLKYDDEYGFIPEQDNEAIIFPVHEGKALCFKFRRLYVVKGKELKGKRIGRLIPPYLTRLQERYSAYLQRPGLTRLPKVAFPAPAPVATVDVIETVAAVAPPEATVVQPEAEEAVAAAAEIKAEGAVETPVEPNAEAPPEIVPAADEQPAQDPPTPAS